MSKINSTNLNINILDLQSNMYDVFSNMSGEEVIQYLTNYLGMQILTVDMANDMIDSGICYPEELGIDIEDELEKIK